MRTKLLLFLASALIILLAAIVGVSRQTTVQVNAAPGVPDTPDSRQIQATIRRAYELRALAGRTFDTIEFASVFVNDPRGGKLPPEWLKLVEDVTGTSSDTTGYLDYELAYYEHWKVGALRLEELWAKAAEEGRQLTLEEVQSLKDRSGRIAAPRAPEGVRIQIDFKSIVVEGDVATAVFDDGPRLNEMTLVKIDGKWYIAGNKILRILL